MTTIWIEPTELKATAAQLAEQAMRIQETMTGTRTTCDCEVPRSLIGWLDAELVAVTEDALRVAVVYLQQAIDGATRANQIQADQSLATAQAAPAPVGAVFGPTVMGGFSALASTPSESATVMGGFSALASTPSASATVMGGFSSYSSTPGVFATEMFIRAPSGLAGFDASGGGANHHIDLWTKSRPGATWIGDGLYKGYDGRVGRITDVYVDKKYGGYRVG